MDGLFSGLFKEVTSEVSAPGAGVMLPRLMAAVLIGTVLALRPWRLLTHKALPKAEMMQAQVLLCTAAAVITAVIGDSTAKAFGLVGLGSFVRFRSGLKDPRDAAILFLMIGLGMACGHGSLGLAGVGTAFVAALLLVLDLFEKKEPLAPKQRMLVSAQADDLAGAEAWLRQQLGERNVLVRSCALDFDGRRLELEVEEKEPGMIASALSRSAGGPLRGLRWSEMPSNKGSWEERG
ncbi:DUF4956 domain-containing protein [Archangium gephyra]|uniref:DUF4956 domain-containing protein n=1 Tax=Archangium gephyra TaxID=48 RepID=UPI0035D4E15E